MASKNSFVLGIFMVLFCGLLSFQSAADEENGTFTESRRELFVATQLLKLFQNSKNILRIFDFYGNVKDATDFAKWIIEKAEDYADGQCQNSTNNDANAAYHCCQNNQFLHCVKCCLGPRQNSTSLDFLAPAPAPSP